MGQETWGAVRIVGLTAGWEAWCEAEKEGWRSSILGLACGARSLSHSLPPSLPPLLPYPMEVTLGVAQVEDGAHGGVGRLGEGDVEGGDVGVEELEADRLKDEGVGVLGVGAVVLEVVEADGDVTVDPVHQRDPDGQHEHRDGLPDS